MADSGKVRLVRCPKCENLLPELADYSLYKCGGCGAVLQAKNKPRETDYLSEKSDEERAERGSSKSENLTEEGQVHLNDDVDADVKSNAGHLGRDKKGLEKDDVGYDEMDGNQSKLTTGKWAADNGLDTDINRDEVANPKGRERLELNSEIGYASGSQRSRKVPDWQSGERRRMEGLQRNPRSDTEGLRFPTSNNMDEGPSNYHANSSYSFGESATSRNDPDGVNRVQYLEQDRVELLRKLDELKDQLSRSCDVGDNPKEKIRPHSRMVPADPYSNSDTWLPDGSLGSNQASLQFLGPEKYVQGPSYFNHYPEPYPCTNTHEMAMHGVYPSRHLPNQMPGYGDPFAPQIVNRAQHQLNGHYPHQSSHPYFSGQYIDTNPASFDPYPHNTIFHQPSCSCIQCYNKHNRASVRVPPAAFSNKRLSDMPSNSMLYPKENPTAFGSRARNAKASVPPPPLTSREPQTHARWPSDVNSEMGGFVHYRPQRVVLASGGRRCHPIAGGAPFITCNNCFELLQVPKKVLRMMNKQQKIHCGACSTVINFAIVNKKLVLSVHEETKRSPKDVDGYTNETVKNGTSYSHDPVKRTNVTFSSDDFDNSGYEFQSLDREPASLPTGQVLNSSKPQEVQTYDSSSPSTSEDEDSPDSLVASGEGVNSVQLPIKAARSPPPPGSPLKEHFDFSSNNHAVNRFGNGSRSSRSDHEKVLPNKIAVRQNSVKELTLATEMEVSFNEYSNTGTSQYSGDTSREEERPRTNKGGESFFANIIKKSFRDFSRSSQSGDHGKTNVSVNGHTLSDRLVKKAEKLAGPIQAGEYWYDSRAGFWGIMGGPCLGIIPPFIEEFNYRIPENCSGGTSGVFVNGRELHQKDLELLASRGLPTARDRSYIVEISGRVLDEDTGEELDSLGRLAPTVEKVKHGFGMKPRRAVAERM